jgi:hypothetical protein
MEGCGGWATSKQQPASPQNTPMDPVSLSLSLCLQDRSVSRPVPWPYRVWTVVRALV